MIVGELEVTALPPIVAWTDVAVPATLPVKVAVYVPLLLSVTLPMLPVEVPPDVEKATVKPPEVSELPAASLDVSVRVELAPEATFELLTLTRDCAKDIVPGVTLMVGKVVVTAAALIVAPIVVAVPATLPVKVAVYVPSPLSIVALMDPVDVPPERVKTTVRPPVVRLFPVLSLDCSVRVEVDPEVIVPLETAIVE